MTRHTWAAAAGGLLLVLGLTACGGDEDETPAGGTEGSIPASDDAVVEESSESDAVSLDLAIVDMIVARGGECNDSTTTSLVCEIENPENGLPDLLTIHLTDLSETEDERRDACEAERVNPDYQVFVGEDFWLVPTYHATAESLMDEIDLEAVPYCP